MKTSRLEAVNTILRAVGETPVASLTTQAGVDSVMAAQTLDDVSKKIQTIGWSWNRRRVTLPIDTQGRIPVAGNVARIVGPEGRHYGVRNGYLFDMERSTIVFPRGVCVEITELLEWDDLPEAARAHIIAKASRKYADSQVGDDALSSASRQDEMETWAVLRRDEILRQRPNIFAPDEQGFARRQSPLGWNE